MFFRISQEKKAKFIKSRRFQSTCQGSQVQIFSSLLAPQTRTRTKLIRVKATPGVIQNPLNFPLARESPRPEMKKGPPFVPKSISSRIFHAFRGPSGQKRAILHLNYRRGPELQLWSKIWLRFIFCLYTGWSLVAMPRRIPASFDEGQKIARFRVGNFS